MNREQCGGAAIEQRRQQQQQQLQCTIIKLRRPTALISSDSRAQNPLPSRGIDTEDKENENGRMRQKRKGEWEKLERLNKQTI